MHFASLLAAVAALGLSVQAVPAPAQTCSYAISQTAPGRVQCRGTLATFKKHSPGAAAQVTAISADGVNDCAAACKGNDNCRTFGYTEDTQTCTLYKWSYAGLLLKADSSSDIAYYSADCFVKSCIKLASNMTTSSIAPCTATQTVLATTTQFSETLSATLTAVDYTTLDPAVTTTTATNYIVQNITAFDIVTVIEPVYTTFTLPDTEIITSTSTLVITVEETSTLSSTVIATSSIYYPLAADNVQILRPAAAACASPVGTVTTTATQTNVMAYTTATTTTVTVTSTPEALMSTVTTNITVNVPVETQTAYFNTTVMVTQTEIVTTTLYAIPISTTSSTSTVLSTVSTTSTTYDAYPTPTCPTSDGTVFITPWFDGDGYESANYTINCFARLGRYGDDQVSYSIGSAFTPDLYSCIQACAAPCSAVEWDTTTELCTFAVANTAVEDDSGDYNIAFLPQS